MAIPIPITNRHGGTYHAGLNAALKLRAPAWFRSVLICAILVPLAVLFALQVAHGQNYSSQLVSGLLRLGYPLDRQTVIALDKISMRFDSANRIDVLHSILNNRHMIHGLKNGDNYEKTQVICNALRLLDELDLPVTKQIIAQLVKESGWEDQERKLLAYMAAKRDIDFNKNISYLIWAIPRKGADLQEEWGGEISLAIMDTCNTLSFLTELFVYRGTPETMGALVNYAGLAYGYPKEYLSYMFIEMLLQRPRLFVDILSAKDEYAIRLVVKSLFFARWTGSVREKVDHIMLEDLADDGYADKPVVKMIQERIARFSPTDQVPANQPHDLAGHYEP